MESSDLSRTDSCSCHLLPEAIEGRMSKTSVLPQKCNAGGKIAQVVTCAERMSPQQDSCWSWVVCFAGVISNIVICGFTFSYGILFPALLDEFQQGKANTAWVGSIAMVGNGMYAPIIGKLYNHFGARTVAFAGSVICVASLIATAKVSNLYIMFTTYGALFGFGSCGVFIITFIAVPRYFKKWRSLSLGLIAMGPGGGVFVMSPLVQELFEKFGWRGTFLCMAGIISVTCFMAFVYQPIVLESEKLELKDDKKFWDISILRHKTFLICVTSSTIIYFGHYVAAVHMVRYLEEIGFAEVKASRFYIYSGVASLLIRPVIGRMNDISWIDPYYIYTVAAIVEAVMTFLLPMATATFHFVVFFVVYGLVDGTMGSGFCIAVLNSVPERLRPLGFGLFQCVSCMTSACGPAFGGFVADLTGSYVPVFHMVGAIYLTGAAILTGVFCVKKLDDKPSLKKEITVWESLIVVEKCSVV